MNKHLDTILCDLFDHYIGQIGTKVCIVTNGTLLLSKSCIDQLKRCPHKVLIVISNYGPTLSRKLDGIKSRCIENKLPYRVEEYYNDDDLKYGGWLDYRDHSLKHKTEDEVIEQAKSCFFRQGKYYEIDNGELHLCSRQFYRMMKGLIPRNERQYINLLHPTQSLEADREKMLEMDKRVYLDSCAYCEGNRADRKRYKPAEQLNREDCGY